ncbi:MAG: segregation/condensation protein A [Candidatus Omnitrophica bacterium]|nr:segregation/condensation protein A [Candidatus Omnitrophota bacterium]
MNYKFRLDMFEGPLDLLLYLIRKNEVNIYDIPVTQITEQYLECIELMKMLDLDGIGEFLVMAATLLQIKSRLLLPPDPNEKEDAQDPRTELVRRLEEYQRIKEAAEELRLRADARSDLFPRRVDAEALNEIKDDSKEVFFEANLFDLITALTAALQKKPEPGSYEVMREEHTVEGKVHSIMHLLIDRPRIFLNELFANASDKMEVIVTFMAVLELCRVKEVVVVQKRLFSEIELVRKTDNILVVPASVEPLPLPAAVGDNDLPSAEAVPDGRA